MAGLSFLSKLQGLGRMFGLDEEKDDSSAEDRKYKILRNMKLERELQGPGPTEKHNLDLIKIDEARKTEQAKTIMTTFAESWKTSGPVGKKLLAEQMAQYHSLLSTGDKAAVKMIVSQTPLNPMVKKGQFFEESFPPVKIDADPTTQPYQYADQVFRARDRDARREHYMTGNMPSLSPMVALADGIWALRKPDGKINLLTSGDLAFQSIADKYDVPVGELMANGGVVYSPEQTIIEDGEVWKVRKSFNAFDKDGEIKTEMRMSNEGIARRKAKEERMSSYRREDMKRLRKMAQAIAVQDTGNVDYLMWKSIEGQTDEKKDEFFKTMFPGWNYRVMDKTKAWAPWTRVGNWLQIYDIVTGARENITKGKMMKFFPGETKFYQTRDKKPVGFITDEETGIVYDNKGEVAFNSIAEAVQAIGSVTEAQLGGM